MRRLLVLLLLSGCATVGSGSVKVAPPEAVGACRYLGEVRGSSGWGGLLAEQGRAEAEAEALAQAEELDASHLVWTATGGGWTGSAAGRAYRCPR